MRTIAAFILALVALPTAAAPAVDLRISTCGPAPPPPVICPAVIPVFHVGEPITIWISAVDADGFRATDYTGTVSFSSSDSSAILPSPHTYVPTDNSAFMTTITFQAPGNTQSFLGSGTNVQTLTASDTANGLTATADFVLFGEPIAAAIPAGTGASLALLAGIILLTGTLTIQRRCHAKRSNLHSG